MSAVRIRASASPIRVARADLFAIAVPALVGAVLCAVELNTRSFWLDEAATLSIASQHGSALWHGIAHDGGNMLLYYLLIHVVISLFGSAAWVLRLPSLIGLAVTGALTTALGMRLLSDRRLAVAAGLLTVVSLPLVFWGQDARGYSLMVTLATASMLAYVVIAQGSDSRSVLTAYVLSTTAALYVGYDAGLVVLAQLALLPLLFRNRVKPVLIGLTITVVLSIPLLVLAVERGSGQLFWVPPLSPYVLGQTAQTLISAAMPAKFHTGASTIVAEVVIGALVSAAVAIGVRAVRDSSDPELRQRLAVILAWLLVPTLVGILVSAAGKPIELDRCSILLMPAISLLLVWALVRLKRPPWLGSMVLVIAIAVRLLQVIPAYGNSPENWQAATAYVLDTAAHKRACVAFYPQDGRQVFDYYLHGRGSRLTPVLPTLPWTQVKPYVEHYGSLSPDQVAQISASCPRLFLIASHAGQASGPPTSRANAARYARLEAEFSARYAHQTARMFSWAAPIYVTEYSR